MGADITLRSALSDEEQEAIVDRVMDDFDSARSIDAMQAVYDALLATGAYFRDPYHRYGLFAVLGMDWSRDVGLLLDAERRLPVMAARQLLLELGSRAITMQAIEDAQHREATGIEAIIERAQEQAAQELDHSSWPAHVRPQQMRHEREVSPEEYMAHLIRRRQLLMALLRRSIELNEPLHCDL
jgi:hypothetical protein